MGLLVSCSIALVSTKDDISKHLFLSGGQWGVEGRCKSCQGLAGPAPGHTFPLTSSSLKGLELDRLNVVDERRHLLRGIDLTAGCALWPQTQDQWYQMFLTHLPSGASPFPHLQAYCSTASCKTLTHRLDRGLSVPNTYTAPNSGALSNLPSNNSHNDPSVTWTPQSSL